MIRLRCETGARPRKTVDWNVPLYAWLVVARSCARFQAHSLLTTGRRRVDLSRVQELHSELDLLMLYEAGILELIAWEEQDRTGALMRIKCADVSEEAVRALVDANLLPEALSFSLLAPDLSKREIATDVLSPGEREALARWSDYKVSLSAKVMPCSPNKSLMRNLSHSAQHCFASI